MRRGGADSDAESDYCGSDGFVDSDAVSSLDLSESSAYEPDADAGVVSSHGLAIERNVAVFCSAAFARAA